MKMKDMNDKEWQRWMNLCFGSSFVGLIVIILAMILCSLFTSCKTITNTEREIVTQHDTTYIERLQRDSIYLHDSIYHEVLQKGDTIYNTKYIERIKYRDRILHDSIYLYRQDTIFVEIERLIEQKTSFVQKAKNWIGGWVIILTILAACFFGIKTIIKRSK